MMKNKIMFSCRLFIVLSCCISSISAASNDTVDDIVSDITNNEVISVNDCEPVGDMDESVL